MFLGNPDTHARTARDPSSGRPANDRVDGAPQLGAEQYGDVASMQKPGSPGTAMPCRMKPRGNFHACLHAFAIQ